MQTPDQTPAPDAARKLKARKRAKNDAATALRKLTDWADATGRPDDAEDLRRMADDIATIAARLSADPANVAL